MLVAVRTEPEQTVQEIDRLHDVFQAVSSKFDTQVTTRAGRVSSWIQASEIR